MFETTQGSVDVGIMTRNIGAMKTFYRDVLGLEETINSDQFQPIPNSFRGHNTHFIEIRVGF